MQENTKSSQNHNYTNDEVDIINSWIFWRNLRGEGQYWSKANQSALESAWEKAKPLFEREKQYE